MVSQKNMFKILAVNLKDLLKINNISPFLFFSGNRCFLCTNHCKGQETICTTCANDLTNNSLACPTCAKPYTSSKQCADCLIQPPIFTNRTWTLFRYHYPVNLLIQQMKFNQKINLANHFGKMFSTLWTKENTALPDCIMPIPLHSSRLIARGYNQSLELAYPLAKHLNIKIDTSSCHRIRATKPQAELPAKKRKQNIHNAFSITKEIDYQYILLIDDVITTGSTVNELARTLRRAGVQRIDVLAVARAD